MEGLLVFILHDLLNNRNLNSTHVVVFTHMHHIINYACFIEEGAGFHLGGQTLYNLYRNYSYVTTQRSPIWVISSWHVLLHQYGFILAKTRARTGKALMLPNEE